MSETVGLPRLPQAPTIGRIVLYRLTAEQAARVNDLRKNASLYEVGKSAQRAEGNAVEEGQVLPLIVTKIWNGEDNSVNGQLLLDGTDSLWAVAATEGSAPGQWSWPVRA